MSSSMYNNPFNVRYNSKNHWVGQMSPRNGFCTFSSRAFGIRAAVIIVCKTYYRLKRFDNIQRIVSTFAPPKDNNNTDAYVSFCCGYVFPGLDVSIARYMSLTSVKVTELTEHFVSLLHAMSIFEGDEVAVSDLVTPVKHALYD